MKQKTILLVFVFMLFASQAIYAETTSISVRGKTFRIGDTADNIFETLKPADSKRKEVVPDPNLYDIEGKMFCLTFARTTDPGPYRLIQISTSSQQKKVSNDSLPATRLTDKQVLEARSKYKIEVLSFDTSKRHGSEFPYADFVRLRVTNASTIVLPVLTVRTNRYSKGKEVGWSRAPSITVSDLKPGQSKEVDYYPKGHLDVVAVDRITVEIEKKVSSEDKKFFKEFK